MTDEQRKEYEAFLKDNEQRKEYEAFLYARTVESMKDEAKVRLKRVIKDLQAPINADLPFLRVRLFEGYISWCRGVCDALGYATAHFDEAKQLYWELCDEWTAKIHV